MLFQFGLHQMRASKGDGKPEPQTLIKFGNPYFKDADGVVSNWMSCGYSSTFLWSYLKFSYLMLLIIGPTRQ